MPCDSGVIHFQRRAHTDHRFSPPRAREWIPQGLLVSVKQRIYAVTPLARVTCVQGLISKRGTSRLYPQHVIVQTHYTYTHTNSLHIHILNGEVFCIDIIGDIE